MERISSRSTWIGKVIFPIFWFGGMGIFVVLILLKKASEGGPPLIAIIAPIFLSVYGYFMMKNLVWDLADEVLDAGDALVVRFGNESDRIPLANIMNVSCSYMMSPARVTLTLREGGRFGSEVSFALSRPFSFNPFAKSRVIGELIHRVDAARRACK
jgi:hypothetical protein